VRHWIRAGPEKKTHTHAHTHKDAFREYAKVPNTVKALSTVII